MSPNWARYEILSLKECQNFFTRNFTEYSSRIICGRGIRASTCQGDSGQALVIFMKGKKKLVGIVSNGYESCEVMGEPEIFTRVDGYLDFIAQTINEN
jgi:secreted trypsin-like serine protease